MKRSNITNLKLSQLALSSRQLETVGLVVAGLFIGYGVIMWVAANWVEFERFTRFAIVGGVLGAAGVLSLLSAPLRLMASLTGILAIGGLMAVIGQEYQSGADPWQLFAVWAGLALPWAIAARHDSAWSLWSVIAFTALPLWMSTQDAMAITDVLTVMPVWIIALLISFLLSPWADLKDWIGSTRWAFRLSMASTIALITGAVLINLGQPISFIGLLVVVAIAAGLARATPFDLPLLAIATLALDVILIGYIMQGTFSSSYVTGSILMVGVYSAVVIAGSAAILISIAKRHGIGDELANTFDMRAWPVIVLSAIGALIAALPLFWVSVVLVGKPLVEIMMTVYVLGLGLLAVAAWLIATSRMLGFFQFLGIIFGVVGLGLLCWGVYRDLPFSIASLVLMAGATGTAAIAIARTQSLHWVGLILGAVACFFAVLSIVGIYLVELKFLLVRPMTLGWLEVAFLGAIGLLLTSQNVNARAARRDDDEIVKGWSVFAAGWTAFALLGLLIASGPTFLFSGGWTKPSSFWLASAPLDLSLTYNRILSMGGLACAYAWLIGTHSKALNPIGLVLMAAAAVLSYVIIGLAAPVVVLAIALTTGRRALAVFSAICALWIIGAFYYWLSWPLINKAYLLVVIGCAVGVLTYALFDHKADHADRQRSGYRQTMGGQPQALASVLIVASLGLSTAVNAAVIWEKEQILANGRKVFVALAPRDPRSIMQGDYMALRFRMPAITSRSRRQAKEAELKWAIASVDAKNVATITTLTSDDVDVLRESQIKLQLKPGKRRPVLGTNAYFFKEGTAKTYQDARFGEFRVNEEGSAILVGLTDENLKRL